MTRPGIIRRAAVALGIALPATAPQPPVAATVARPEAVDAVPLPAAPAAAAIAPAPLPPACGRRGRRASAGEVAEGVARDLVDQGLAGYPLLPEDVDEAGAAWCAERGLTPAPAALVREALATLAGVTRKRTRLRADDAAHVAIARRLRRLGRPDDRATIFIVKPGPRLLQRNPIADSGGPRATAAGRAKLHGGVIAPRLGESTSDRMAEAEGEAESAARPVVRRSA